MPKRPPKKWMKDCIKGVKKSKDVDDPGAVCGDLWYNEMSKEGRHAALRRHEALKRKHR